MNDSPRSLPCKYFYDERGSKLFDAICELDEYYLTRAELEIMRDHSPEIAAAIGGDAVVIEFGSGSSVKTRLLLEQLPKPCVYVPVDISGDHLQQVADKLNKTFPQVTVLPVSADFTKPFELPTGKWQAERHVVYFPGSTIGNLELHRARQLLSSVVQLCQPAGGLIIGIDLIKDIDTIEAAYDDRLGVTAEFNLNLLRRINNELQANFDLDQFRHSATFDEERARVEISVISETDQTVSIANHEFEIQEGDAIRTEYSHKYSIESFEEIAAGIGLSLQKAWTDAQHRFAVLHFAVS